MSVSRGHPLLDLDACPCSGRTLGKFVQPAVMTVLAGGDLHGYQIVKRLTRLPTLGGSRPDSTGVYRVLRSMEKQGFVVSTWDLSDRGPAKKSYRLTSSGRQCLCQWVTTLEEYRTAISGLLRAARQVSVKR